MNVCVIGTGYVGLVTGVVFADLGNEVICVDILQAKIDALNAGEIPIYEPGLQEMVQRNQAEGRLTFTTDTSAAVKQSDIVFIAVGTPPTASGATNLSYVEAAAATVGKALEKYTVVVNKSTVPVGTGDLVRRVVSENAPKGVTFDVVSNPEFLREGSAIADTLKPDRIVIGASNQQAAMKLVELYAPLERPMIMTDVASAEVIKYASNAFLAMKISFANAVATLSEAAGADVTQVTKGMGLDSRIGGSFLQAGIGYGGSCFPKDTRSLLHTAKDFGYDFNLLQATIDTNESQSERFVERLSKELGGLKGKRIGVLGLAFKGNTDDIRESKSLTVVAALQQAGASVCAYDPVAMDRVKQEMPDLEYKENAYEAAEKADAVVIATEWNEFKQLNLDRLKTVMHGTLLADGRNLYQPANVAAHGLTYLSVGRSTVHPK